MARAILARSRRRRSRRPRPAGRRGPPIRRRTARPRRGDCWLHSYPHAIDGPANAALQHATHTEFPPHLLHIHGTALVGEARIARDGLPYSVPGVACIPGAASALRPATAAADGHAKVRGRRHSAMPRAGRIRMESAARRSPPNQSAPVPQRPGRSPRTLISQGWNPFPAQPPPGSTCRARLSGSAMERHQA